MQIIVWVESFVILLLIGVIVFLFRNRKSTASPSNSSFDLLLLTQKEREILDLIAAGKTNKEVALQLHVELSTVKTHVNNIYKKMGVSNRSAAIETFKKAL
ncbi:response regulator transcription factor [Prolixibacteraceae bacterium JC049]|nr:response regulator transcription factor [Prolixibacteraceae bacterium JC049]